LNPLQGLKNFPAGDGGYSTKAARKCARGGKENNLRSTLGKTCNTKKNERENLRKTGNWEGERCLKEKSDSGRRKNPLYDMSKDTKPGTFFLEGTRGRKAKKFLDPPERGGEADGEKVVIRGGGGKKNTGGGIRKYSC